MGNAMGHDEAARLLTEFVRRELVGRIVPLMGEATAELRGSLVAPGWAAAVNSWLPAAEAAGSQARYFCPAAMSYCR
ncbi:MAG: hypothetical protein MUE92_12160 [Chloroflexi bacterium]|jgi:hypothetical protein|nr:hypothetical protein [Chloroflexota bacterium]